MATDDAPAERPRSASRKTGGWLLAGAFTLTVALAFLPSGEEWAGVVSVILVLVSGGLQFGSAMVFDRVGRADPSHAKAAFSRLILLASQAQRARIRAENAFSTQSGAALKASVGKLSVDLSYLEEGVGAAAKDWSLFHPDVISAPQEHVQKKEEEGER